MVAHRPLHGSVRTYEPHARSHKRGSIAFVAAIAIVVAVAVLRVINVACVFRSWRDLQTIVDLAARAAASQIGGTLYPLLAPATAYALGDSSDRGGATVTEANGAIPLNDAIVPVTKLAPDYFGRSARRLQPSTAVKATVIGSFSLAGIDLLDGMLESSLGTEVSPDAVSSNWPILKAGVLGINLGARTSLVTNAIVSPRVCVLQLLLATLGAVIAGSMRELPGFRQGVAYVTGYSMNCGVAPLVR
ncbi:hypothetical protein SAMN05421548_13925 [Paraburkholderia lycopersici]|uniref:Uncharacterized protein n=1 Tax=Paraburkholderia lycopersici TaxID=416944 RepID=A0A1G7BGC1_9BURK|nr:hypothetical protein SAMN05421548_13925 [Paraburkholderia lycopersici]